MSQRRSSRGKLTKEKDKDHKEKCNGISKKDQDQWIILVNGNFIRLLKRKVYALVFFVIFVSYSFAITTLCTAQYGLVDYQRMIYYYQNYMHG